MKPIPQLAPNLKQLRLSGTLDSLEARNRHAVESKLAIFASVARAYATKSGSCAGLTKGRKLFDNNRQAFQLDKFFVADDADVFAHWVAFAARMAFREALNNPTFGAAKTRQRQTSP
jgi:hypothetical protein